MLKVRKGRLRFVRNGWRDQPAITYKTLDLKSNEVVYVPNDTPVISLGSHCSAGKSRLYVQVLSCMGVVWIETCYLSNGPE